jgi:hypothetical protein
MVDPRKKYPGTLELAALLGIKHPITREKSKTDSWILTTDRLIVYGVEAQGLHLLSALAVAAKPQEKLTQREWELLFLEKMYWEIRGVRWILFTPELFDPRVNNLLRSTAGWAFDDEVDHDLIVAAQTIHQAHPNSPLQMNLQRLAVRLGRMELAQRAFWQAVWSEALSIDLRMGWNPNFSYPLLSLADFRNLNPITMRRSSWKPRS